MEFDVFFGIPLFGDGTTLFEAVWARGGGANAMARHAVAAVLNYCNADVHFCGCRTHIITAVQMAYDTGDYESVKNYLEMLNEAGCPLGRAVIDMDGIEIPRGPNR
jgi:hypothetical protein